MYDLIRDPSLVMERVRALFCAHEDVRRNPLGGFRCADCQRAGASLNEFGYDIGYVAVEGPLLQAARASGADAKEP